MKTLSIKLIVACIVSASFAIQSFAQAPMKPIEEGGKMPAKLDKAQVPKPVTDTYIVEYPSATYDSWYGYPAFTDESDWYGYNPYRYSAMNPEYYMVEFTKDQAPHKVVYSKEGKKVATHKKVYTEVPKAISSEMIKGDYKGWKIANEKEEIFKDGDSDQMKVYKLTVEKGKEKHILYYLPSGKLIKDKVIKS
jgi:hypothetical protein